MYLYRYSETEDGTPVLDNIESDEEYEIVADAFDELLDSQEYDELISEEELEEEKRRVLDLLKRLYADDGGKDGTR